VNAGRRARRSQRALLPAADLRAGADAFLLAVRRAGAAAGADAAALRAAPFAVADLRLAAAFSPAAGGDFCPAAACAIFARLPACPANFAPPFDPPGSQHPRQIGAPPELRPALLGLRARPSLAAPASRCAETAGSAPPTTAWGRACWPPAPSVPQPSAHLACPLPTPLWSPSQAQALWPAWRARWQGQTLSAESFAPCPQNPRSCPAARSGSFFAPRAPGLWPPARARSARARTAPP